VPAADGRALCATPGSAPRPDALDWAPESAGPGPFTPAEVFAAGLRHHHLANTAYPIAHRRTIWRYRQPEERHAALLAGALGPERPLGLYLHLPFCERRCGFCEYTVVPTHDEAVEARYHAALLRELELHLENLGGARELVGLDLGGGTPGLVQPARIAELVARVRAGFRLAPGFGISLETTPRLAARAPERLAALRAAGVDRLSMGLQVVSDHLLQQYGRAARVEENAVAVEHVRRAGFACLNLDLMYGLARQSLDDLRHSLEAALRLDPEVITLYRMRYKGTSVQAEARQVSLERVAEMHELAHDLLGAAGYAAVPGQNSFTRVPGDPGTSAYLTARVVWGVPYLGLGLGAQSFTGNLLAYNEGAASKRLEPYLAAVAAGRLPLQDLYHLPPSEGMAKMLAVSFYAGAIERRAFHLRFGVALEERFPAEVAFVLERGLMVERGSRLCLTRAGARAVSGVIALFYSDAVKAHLLALGGGAADERRDAEAGGAPAEAGGAPAEAGGAPAEAGGAPAEAGGAS